MLRTHAARALLFLAAVLLVLGGCEKKKGLKITGLSPKTGPYMGGDPVRIEGYGFQSGGAKGIRVYFGEQEAKNVVFEGDEVIRVEPPPGEVGQVVDIVIMFDDARTATLEKAYTYIDPQAGFGVDELTKKKEEGQ